MTENNMTSGAYKLLPGQKEEVKEFLKSIQSSLLNAFAEVNGSGEAEINTWQREEGGGGQMGVFRGDVVEKAGANFSEVYGKEYPAIEGKYKGKPFYATGVSTICHMNNPNAPIAHMNVRLLEVGDDFWFGGGADLTPFIEFAEDTAEFHATLKEACDQLAPDAYDKYKKWCDEYFYIPHRNSPRGVGGIFFDYLQKPFEEGFAFIQRVATAYTQIYPKILKRRKAMAFDESMKDKQLYWRGRYAEFNLVYDRGTKFGLMTGGNIEAIFVSLPPVVKW